MSALSPLIRDFPIGSTLGTWILSVAANFLLNGILFHQTYRYFCEYGNDRMLLKVWVVIVVVLQTFLSALIFYTAWFYLIQLYWEPGAFLEKMIWSLNLLPVAGPITALFSQAFFCRRLWLLAPKFKIIAACVFFLNVGNVGCFTALSVKLFQTPKGDAAKFTWLASVAVSIQMLGDIILMVALIYVFRKSRTGIDKTDSMLEALMAYAIGTGAVNCVGHLLSVIFSIVYPHNWVYVLFSCVDIKLYAMGFLVALDSRKFLNMTRLSDDSCVLSNWQLESSGVQSNMPTPHAQPPPIAIELKVVTEVVQDDDSDETHSKGHSPEGNVA